MGELMCASNDVPAYDVADEPVHWQDRTCDYCAKTQYTGSLHPQKSGQSIAWLCDRCVARDAERYAAMTGTEAA